MHCRGNKTLKQEIRTAYAPKTAEYLIRNLHKPLDVEMLKRAGEVGRCVLCNFCFCIFFYMNGKVLMKFLEENNYHLERVKGSHHIMDNGSVSVSVPIHGNSDIARGTLASILKDSGLTEKFRSVYGKIK